MGMISWSEAEERYPGCSAYWDLTFQDDPKYPDGPPAVDLVMRGTLLFAKLPVKGNPNTKWIRREDSYWIWMPDNRAWRHFGPDSEEPVIDDEEDAYIIKTMDHQMAEILKRGG